MRAIVRDSYGPPEQLASREIERPSLGENEVLVRVHNAGVNIADSFSVRGAPFPTRLMTGLTRPRQVVPGFDLAGEIESVGGSVTRFRVGEAVFGSGNGTFADFASAAEDTLAAMPAGLSFEEAASIPTAGLAALHGLRDAAHVQPGQDVLIIGASGGV